jgi:hypothetical protein
VGWADHATHTPTEENGMRKAIVVAATIILMVTGIVLGKSTTQNSAPSSPQAITTFELMSRAKDLPVAPHPDAF